MMQLKLLDLTKPTETPSEALMVLYGAWAERCADVKSNVSTIFSDSLSPHFLFFS